MEIKYKEPGFNYPQLVAKDIVSVQPMSNPCAEVLMPINFSYNEFRMDNYLYKESEDNVNNNAGIHRKI